MYYVAGSDLYKAYIIGQTTNSQYSKCEVHFMNSVKRLNLDYKSFDYFNIFSLPGEDEEFNSIINKLNEKGFYPINKSSKYLNYIYDLTHNAEIFIGLDKRIENMAKIKAKDNNKKAYGEFKRVLLSDSEYFKLCEEFGEDKVEAVIPYVDEYIESNNNKNKYSNFYIVMKKAIRGNWYNIPDKKEAKEKTPVPDFVNEFINNIK